MATVWTISAIGAGALLLAGCSTPSARIANELTRYGLDQNQAKCVGDRLEARLSLAQLQQLARAANAYSRNDTSPRRLTVGDLTRVSAQIDDSRMPIEVASAAASCGVLGSLLSL